MSIEAEKFKKNNSNLEYNKMTLNELGKLPLHNGILNFKITDTSFLILNILNDDSSAVKYFWKGEHDLPSLDLWYKISKNQGTYIDIGAHTGLYTLTSLKSNSENRVLSFEPFYMNMSRLITNLRLNGKTKNVETYIAAVSDFSGKSYFSVETDMSYLSKGGKIHDHGTEINVHKIDDICLDKKYDNIKGIKIDTEGEDYKVLKGSEIIIKKYRPEIIIEVREENKNKINSFFRENNYKLFDVIDLKKEIDLTNYTIKNISNIYAKPN
tara:strand:+ start:7670 stop:8473 length:804 start_codon:yes stop_codon:yes gene_type:complete